MLTTREKIERLKITITNLEDRICQLKIEKKSGYDVTDILKEEENLLLDLKDTLDILEFEEYNNNRDYFGG